MKNYWKRDKEWIFNWENYKSKDIIVYCNTGRKSAEVAEKLVEHGFTDVTNIVDGVSEYDFKLVK